MLIINKILPLTLKSTLILSGREKLELGSRYVDQCYFHKLHGLSVEQAKNLLQNFELKGSHTDWKNFVEKYSGNVLSLKIVATEICNRCQKNIGKFLMSPHIPHELNDLLDEQFSRFSTIEKVLLYWCSVKREPVTFEYLKNKIVGFNNSNEYLYEAIDNILDHCFLDSFEFEEEGYYQLQPVIMEFLTKKLISSIINEINNGKSEYLNYVGLIDTVAKEYILEGNKILCEKILKLNNESNTYSLIGQLFYHYDLNNELVSVENEGNIYFYVKDLLGVIHKIVDVNGNTVVQYLYDGWGKLINSYYGSVNAFVAQYNPFIYKSYYYDKETKLYYLNSRFYSPELKQFLTIDDINYLDESLGNMNLFS